MSDDPIIDTTHLDRYLRSRHRVEVLNSAWKPALAGAAGAVAIIGAVVVGVWVAGPRFAFREIEVPRVTFKDVTVPNAISKDVEVPHIVERDVEIQIPRFVPEPLSAAPRSSTERLFENTPEWRSADVRGRLIREQGNGFILTTEDGGQQSFSPARLVNGKPESNSAVKDVVAPCLGDLCLCHPLPTGVYECVALHEGREVPIQQIPVIAREGRPT